MNFYKPSKPHQKGCVETISRAFVATAMLCGRILRDTLVGVLRAAATWANAPRSKQLLKKLRWQWDLPGPQRNSGVAEDQSTSIRENLTKFYRKSLQHVFPPDRANLFPLSLWDKNQLARNDPFSAILNGKILKILALPASGTATAFASLIS